MDKKGMMLAKISKVWLGIEDHGILSMNIFFDLEDGGSQGYGGYSYSHRDKKSGKTVGHASLAEHVYELLSAFKVETLDELVGKYCWVEKKDFFDMIHSVTSMADAGSVKVDLKKTSERCYEREKKLWPD